MEKSGTSLRNWQGQKRAIRADPPLKCWMLAHQREKTLVPILLAPERRMGILLARCLLRGVAIKTMRGEFSLG